MLTIRLQRTGKKNQASFRIVLAEKQAPVKKKHLEVLGSYNPRKKDFKVNDERVKYWITQRVEMSPTVHNLFVTKGLVEGSKAKAFNVPKKAVEPVVSTTSPAETAGTLPIAGGDKTPEVAVEPEPKPVEASSAPEASTPTETPAA
ncbi:MAG: 30S ribosomal protein S16 [Candidatus Doudnabacteria bacterium]|nr:30S ribosomal protein S16 [Candidatus Doudnabacteria bacterium]